jgi:hypothetical protein
MAGTLATYTQRLTGVDWRKVLPSLAQPKEVDRRRILSSCTSHDHGTNPEVVPFA